MPIVFPMPATITFVPFSVLLRIPILIRSTISGTDLVIGRFIVVMASSRDWRHMSASMGIAFCVVESSI